MAAPDFLQAILGPDAMFKKILIANRGEIACRVIRACRELSVKSVAIFSEADRESLHVRLADEAICVGAGTNSDSYLNLANVLMATQISGADAVHPGYGYFSERANFAVALEALGVVFVGPPTAAIEAMSFSNVLWLYILWNVACGLVLPFADIPINAYM